jgi:hypothetical protein
MVRRFPFVLHTTCGTVIDQTATRASALDTLAGIGPSTLGSIEHTVKGLGRDPGGASLAVLTGRSTTDDLACIAPLRQRFDAITIGRFGPHRSGELALAAGSVLVNAASVAEFAKAWNRRAR